MMEQNKPKRKKSNQMQVLKTTPIKKISTLCLFFSTFILTSNAQKVPESMGVVVNTEYSELNPVIAPDGKTFYFGRKNHPQNKFGVAGTETVKGSQDIWFSENIMGAWSTARRMSEILNRDQYNTILSVSPDGQTILLKGSYVNGQYDARGFSITQKNEFSWDIPVKVNIPKYNKMSKGQNEYAFLSNDGKTILMAFSEDKKSDEDDIYATFKNKDGSWSEIIGLGSDINTNYTETTPFLAADGKTMYFSSNRPGGLGNNDIYVTKRLDETWINWSEPINIGSPINTDAYDAYYSVAAAGDYAYFVSDKNSLGKKDIFRLKLDSQNILFDTTKIIASNDPNKSKSNKKTLSSNDKNAVQNNTDNNKVAEPVVLLSGKIIDAKTGKVPQNASVIYEDLSTGKEIGTAKPDPQTGKYTIVLPYGKNYGITAKGKGIIASSQNLDLRKIKAGYLELSDKDITTTPLEQGAKVTMNNIFFEFGKATLKSESFTELNRIADLLKENPDTRIEIGGHTDDVGTDEVNNKISLERADAVKSYLLEQKINVKRIDSKGYGKMQPKVPNTSPENQAINRRVEFKIL